MTKDDLIRMADLAGYDVDDDDDVYAPAQGRYGLDPRLQKFAELVATAERESCAKLCEHLDQVEYATAGRAATAIRARGDKHD